MKKVLCLLLCGVMLFSLCGCNLVLDVLVGPILTEEQEAIPHLGFSRGALFEEGEDEDILYFTVEEFAQQPIEYDVYRSSMHYETLTENDRVVYHAYEYALENGYNNVLLDDLLVEDPNALLTALEFLALDSPLLEQNVRFTYGNFTSYYPVVGLNGLYETQAELDGYYVTVHNFEKPHWDKKMIALDKAKEIVNALPEKATDEEKALALFQHVSEKVTYGDEMYPELLTAVYPHLYDALVGGKSQCDGMANALALLYRLAGINCAEKMDPPKKDKDEVGHTWVFFELDGKWYNSDATADAEGNPSTEHMRGGYYFAFPDELLTHPTVYPTIYAPSTDGLYITVDARLDNCEGDDLYMTALSALNHHHREWFLVTIKDYDEDAAAEQVQDIVNYYLCSCRYYAFKLKNDSTAFLVCLYDE